MTTDMNFSAVDLPIVTCPTCDSAYVLRLSFAFPAGTKQWLYQSDCKHKAAPQSLDPAAVEWARVDLARLP